jgi:hypothetical protein
MADVDLVLDVHLIVQIDEERRVEHASRPDVQALAPVGPAAQLEAAEDERAGAHPQAGRPVKNRAQAGEAEPRQGMHQRPRQHQPDADVGDLAVQHLQETAEARGTVSRGFGPGATKRLHRHRR